MMKEMYWACADALTLGSQVGRGVGLTAPETLRERIGEVLEQTARRAQAAGIPKDDVTDACYALCAFLDERILAADWEGRQAWTAEPLQLRYYGENTAGEGFFRRLEELEASGRRSHVLQIYFLCLTLGFRGKYAVVGSTGLAEIIDRVGKRLSDVLPPSDVLSPHGAATGSVKTIVRRELPLVAASIGVLALSIVIFAVLKGVIASKASRAVKDMRSLTAQVRPP